MLQICNPLASCQPRGRGGGAPAEVKCCPHFPTVERRSFIWPHFNVVLKTHTHTQTDHTPVVPVQPEQRGTTAPLTHKVRRGAVKWVGTTSSRRFSSAGLNQKQRPPLFRFSERKRTQQDLLTMHCPGSKPPSGRLKVTRLLKNTHTQGHTNEFARQKRWFDQGGRGVGFEAERGAGCSPGWDGCPVRTVSGRCPLWPGPRYCDANCHNRLVGASLGRCAASPCLHWCSLTWHYSLGLPAGGDKWSETAMSCVWANIIFRGLSVFLSGHKLIPDRQQKTKKKNPQFLTFLVSLCPEQITRTPIYQCVFTAH